MHLLCVLSVFPEFFIVFVCSVLSSNIFSGFFFFSNLIFILLVLILFSLSLFFIILLLLHTCTHGLRSPFLFSSLIIFSFPLFSFSFSTGCSGRGWRWARAGAADHSWAWARTPPGRGLHSGSWVSSRRGDLRVDFRGDVRGCLRGDFRAD